MQITIRDNSEPQWLPYKLILRKFSLDNIYNTHDNISQLVFLKLKHFSNLTTRIRIM